MILAEVTPTLNVGFSELHRNQFTLKIQTLNQANNFAPLWHISQAQKKRQMKAQGYNTKLQKRIKVKSLTCLQLGPLEREEVVAGPSK